MTPFFNPGPNPFGPPPIFLGGVGPRMTEMAGEVADGLIVHPFDTRRTLEELVLPALDVGLAPSGRRPAPIEVMWVVKVVTWSNDAERDEAMRSAKASSPSTARRRPTRPTLDLHGCGDLQPELNRLSKQGHWDDMIDLVPDEWVRDRRGRPATRSRRTRRPGRA